MTCPVIQNLRCPFKGRWNRGNSSFFTQKGAEGDISNTKAHICACDICDRVTSSWQVRLCIRILPSPEWKFFHLPQTSLISLLYQHAGKSTFRTGGIRNSEMCCSGCGHCSRMNICSLTYCSSGTWQSLSPCCQATKTAPALGGEQTDLVTQRRNVTWLASKMKRGLSGPTQDHGCWNQHESGGKSRNPNTSHFFDG